jgi:hypothetical protein
MFIRGHTLIDLKDVHTRPRNVFRCQRSQHNPWSVTTADSQGKAATGSDHRTCIGGDRHRPGSRDRIGVIKHFELHGVFLQVEEFGNPSIRT